MNEDKWGYLMGSGLWNVLMGNVRSSGARHSQTEAGQKRAEELHSDPSKKTPVYDVTITLSDIKRRWIEQDGKCYWTGMEMSLDELKNPFSPFAVSVDRLDNSHDYHLYNIVLTTRFGNLGRGAYPKEDFQEKLNQLLDRRRRDPIHISDLRTEIEINKPSSLESLFEY